MTQGRESYSSHLGVVVVVVGGGGGGGGGGMSYAYGRLLRGCLHGGRKIIALGRS